MSYDGYQTFECCQNAFNIPDVPDPKLHTPPQFKKYVVQLMYQGCKFMCEITLPLVPGHPEPTMEEVGRLAEQAYMNPIRRHIDVGAPLPPPVRQQAPHPTWLSKVSPTKPKSIADIYAEQLAKMGGKIAEQSAAPAGCNRYNGNEYDERTGKILPPRMGVQQPKATCEADKPEGTRDVDKFLKEQQDKLWSQE